MTEAFHAIISMISNHASLTLPLSVDCFQVQCDASTYGVGGVLCVCRSDVTLPVAFYSRQLCPRESRYSATELEALAMVDTIKHFSFYLHGRPFTVLSDHRALEQFFNSPRLNNRLWRWRIQLMDFDFQIKYVEGRKNSVPDALSRQGWLDDSTPIVANFEEGGDVVELPPHSSQGNKQQHTSSV